MDNTRYVIGENGKFVQVANSTPPNTHEIVVTRDKEFREKFDLHNENPGWRFSDRGPRYAVFISMFPIVMSPMNSLRSPNVPHKVIVKF